MEQICIVLLSGMTSECGILYLDQYDKFHHSVVPSTAGVHYLGFVLSRVTVSTDNILSRVISDSVCSNISADSDERNGDDIVVATPILLK